MFIEKAFAGRNQVWRYLATILIVFIATEFIGGIPFLIVLFSSMAKNGTSGVPQNPADFSAMGVDSNLGLLVMLIPFAIGLIFLFLSINKIHRRSIITVLTTRNRFSWSRLLFGAAIWTLFMTISLIFHLVIEPSNYVFKPDWNAFIPLVIVAIIFIPFQAAFEEVLFRGYLLQAFGLLLKYRWLAVLVTGIGFGLLHSFNPEVKAYGFWLTMPEYVGLGLFFGLIVLLDEGLELVMGIHILNNIFLSLFVTTESSSLQTSAIIHVTNLNSYTDLSELYIFMILFLVVARRKYNWTSWQSRIFGRIDQTPFSPNESQQVL